MFERFTDSARRVVVLSQQEAGLLRHNYIGTEHLLLGMIGEAEGLACRALTGLGMSLEGTRQEVAEVVGTGSAKRGGHIPFTPRAKKTLELALREALQLNHDYISTEHLLLGLIREGEHGGKDEGAGVRILRRHAELPAIRAAVVNLLPPASAETPAERRWRRARLVLAGKPGAEQAPAPAALNATPAADATLSEAVRLAATQPVGSHHLLLASLADPGTAAARALAALGVDLDKAREALRGVDVTGTSDELPEEAGRRQLVLRVTGERLTLESADPVLVKAGNEALAALGGQAEPPGTIRGDLPASASLGTVWRALLDSLGAIRRSAASPAGDPAAGPPA